MKKKNLKNYTHLKEKTKTLKGQKIISQKFIGAHSLPPSAPDIVAIKRYLITTLKFNDDKYF